jgi:hypothetical protein
LIPGKKILHTKRPGLKFRLSKLSPVLFILKDCCITKILSILIAKKQNRGLLLDLSCGQNEKIIHRLYISETLAIKPITNTTIPWLIKSALLATNPPD